MPGCESLLAPPQSGVLYWQCSSVVAKIQPSLVVLAAACKNGVPQLCLRCLGGRHSYVYAVLAGSNSVPVSSIISQRTYAADWSAAVS